MASTDDPPDHARESESTNSTNTASSAETPSDRSEDPPESQVELMRQLETFLEDIDREAPTIRARSTPEDHYAEVGRLGESTRTQGQVGLDYVRDDGIAVDGDTYIGLLEITPRNWLSLDSDERETVMSAYMSFLMSLRSPIVIACYPHEFDLESHLQQFADVGQSPDTQGESPILQYGRKYYIDWASRRVDEQQIKRRAFYIVTRVDAGHVHEALDSGRVASRLPLVGSVLDGLRSVLGAGDSSEQQAREELCIREVRTRQQRIAENLGRTGVGLDMVRDRQKTMEILYHYYNHVEPLVDRFDHATRTEATTETPSGGGR